MHVSSHVCNEVSKRYTRKLLLKIGYSLKLFNAKVAATVKSDVRT